MKLITLFAALSFASTFFIGCGGGDQPTTKPEAENKAPPKMGATGGKPKIAVIPKGTTHEFWKSIHAGAVKAQLETSAPPTNEPKFEIIWRGPIREGESEAQIKVVEDMINLGVAGIVLAPNDSNALRSVVEQVATKRIPLVIIDSDVNTDKYKSFVATDNHKGGNLGGKKLAELLGGKGKVLILRYQEGSASTEKREQGFLDAAKEAGLEVVSSNQYGGDTADTAQKAAESLLSAHKNADGSLKVDGIFTPNESTTFGMLRALQDAKQAGKVKFVGFDASEKLVTALSSGEINALVIQNPMNMGYLGVKTMYDAMREKKVEKRIDTGVAVATKENMESPEIKEILHPDLEKYLK